MPAEALFLHFTARSSPCLILNKQHLIQMSTLIYLATSLRQKCYSHGHIWTSEVQLREGWSIYFEIATNGRILRKILMYTQMIYLINLMKTHMLCSQMSVIINPNTQHTQRWPLRDAENTGIWSRSAGLNTVARFTLNHCSRLYTVAVWYTH